MLVLLSPVLKLSSSNQFTLLYGTNRWCGRGKLPARMYNYLGIVCPIFGFIDVFASRKKTRQESRYLLFRSCYSQRGFKTPPTLLWRVYRRDSTRTSWDITLAHFGRMAKKTAFASTGKRPVLNQYQRILVWRPGKNDKQHATFLYQEQDGSVNQCSIISKVLLILVVLAPLEKQESNQQKEETVMVK